RQHTAWCTRSSNGDHHQSRRWQRFAAVGVHIYPVGRGLRALSHQATGQTMKIFRIAAAGSSLLVALAGSSAKAQVFNTSFGGADYTCFNSVTGAADCNNSFTGRPASYIWVTDDFVRQVISGSGLAAVTGLSIN